MFRDTKKRNVICKSIKNLKLVVYIGCWKYYSNIKFGRKLITNLVIKLMKTTLIFHFSCDSCRWRRCYALFSWIARQSSHGSAYLQCKYLSLPRRMDRPELWHHFIRQHRISDVDGFSMCQYGRMDSNSICSK